MVLLPPPPLAAYRGYCRPLASAVRSAQDSAAAGVMKTLSGEDVTGEGAKEGKKEREREESLDGPFYGEESESERESVCLARRSAVHARTAATITGGFANASSFEPTRAPARCKARSASPAASIAHAP